METNQIPVSFEFFKKYTYHEEWVELMFKMKSKGNQQLYETLINSKDSKERALKSYYEAFYLRPKIRENYHIRVKPLPQRIRDKLLSIPQVATSIRTETLVTIGKEESNDCEDELIEDDEEPSTSLDVKTNLEKSNTELNLSTETQKNIYRIQPKHQEKNSINILLAPNFKELMNKIFLEKAIVSPSIPTEKMPNYKSYIQCFPLTLKEFRKSSNVPILIRNFCEEHKIVAFEERLKMLARFYILFYLAPEHRSMPPLNKIKLVDHCPADIKEKYFNFPQNLYFKNHNEPIAAEKVVVKLETDTTNDINQSNLATITASLPNDLHINVPVAVRQQETTVPIKNNCNEKLNSTQQIIIHSIQPVTLNASCSERIIKTEEKIKPSVSTNTTDPIILNNNKETNYNLNQQKIITAPDIPITDPLLNVPVSLDEFKKYTYHEEVIEKLFKIKAQNNEDLYLKYKNSHEAFVNTLKNYYRAFYFLPAIRDIFPIRIKLVPNFLKNRLLYVPEGAQLILDSFKVEQLVSPELNIATVNEKESLTAKYLPIENAVKEKEVPLEPMIILKRLRINAKSSDCGNKKSLFSNGVKRASNEINELTSPKRQKIQQMQNNSNEQTKKLYRDLLPYAHCCPVSFSQFKRYTNVSDLFSGFCQKLYKSLAKLPYMLNRAYLLYYLAPENRNFKPLNNLKILNDCPANLRNKIFEIPTKLYLKGERPNRLQNLEKDAPEKQIEDTEDAMALKEYNRHLTTTNIEKVNKTFKNPKEPIEILENRLLPPTTQIFSYQTTKESQCFNTSCVFYHLSNFDFMRHTNILSHLPERQEPTVIKNIFKKLIYKVIKDQSVDDKYMASFALLPKLLKYHKICEKCESDETLFNTDLTLVSSSESENERGINVTVIERCPINNDSSTLNPGNTVENIQQATMNTDLLESLKRDKVFLMFRQKLLVKINQSLDGQVFSADNFKIFLQNNEIPLRQIVNDFCNNNQVIVQRILNEIELYEALQRYYYYKYLTNENFALKYPTKLKEKYIEKVCSNPEEPDEKSANENNNTSCLDKEQISPNSLSVEKISFAETSTIQKENLNNLPLTQNKVLNNNNNNNNNSIEKAKRIFFRNVEKTNTLYYVLRTSFGLKQLILRTVLNLTFKEFIEITSVYEGNELYSDNHIADCMYRYVFRNPLVWPTNLYITLKNLCKYLHKNNIRFDDYSTMLIYISPKLLHWSVMLSCTNILDCIKIDFEKRTGKVLNTFDTKTLKEECIDYYYRCWKHEKWLGETPLVNEEFYKDFLNDKVADDVTILNKSAVQEVCEEPAEVAAHLPAYDKNLVPNLISDVSAEKNAVINLSANASRLIEHFNYVVMPNTQHQIEMLPAEEIVSNDPLDSNGAFNLNNSSNTSENNEVAPLDELIHTIKTEPINQKLLSNLLFYEDDNNRMQCMPYKDEIIYLDDSMLNLQDGEENLLPSQIDFENSSQGRVIYDVLVNSGNNNSFINLAQHIPRLDVSNGSIDCTQQVIQQSQSNQIQLPDVSLKSSGDNEGNLQDIERTNKSPIKNTQILSGTLNAGHTNTPLQQKQFEQVTAIKELTEAPQSTIESVQPLKILNQLWDNPKTGVALQHGITKTYSSIKRFKTAPKAKPLKNSDIVPQIQHNTRPLQTKPAHTDSSSKDLHTDSEMSTTPSVMLSLAVTTSNSSNSTEQSTQNSSFQLQLSPAGNHIYISQEMNKNCSVFDSTLLKIVADNCHKQNALNLSLGTSQTRSLPAINEINENNQQPKNISTHPNTSSNLLPINTANNNKQQVRAKIITPRMSNLYGDTNDKVNELTLTHTNNLAATFTPIRHQLFNKPVVRKLCLHREIIKFHYFKELTHQHISQYLLPSLEIGKSYTEAMILSENFKTRITNRSISTLFPFWSQNLQRDFLLVLDDLREFHYVVYDRASMQRQDDLRARILFWLLHTAPSFALCQIIFECNNREFARCETIKNNNNNNPTYQRKPFQCLTNALSSKVIEKLREIKLNLKKPE